MSPKKVRSCILYARISLRTEESVSIARQIESGEAYAKARGWKVLGTYVDEGVSATHNRPENRKGWQAALDAVEPGCAVVIWKVDRLARRVLDFLNANEAVKERGAGIVAVEDPIDMTTAQGEAFAIMLAVFGQLESAAMRERQTAARNYLLRSGRSPGGVAPFGFRQVPNPSGPGHVLAHDPEQIEHVREMVRRTMAGRTVYSTKQWLEDAGVPAPGGGAEWRWNAVERVLRHPLLAGMVPHNPGNTTSHERGDDVVRDENGLPVIEDSLAIMTVTEWRAMQAILDAPGSGPKTPRALRRSTSGLLSGLMWCAEHPEPVRMWRGTLGSKAEPRPAYLCRECKQSFSRADDVVVPEVLARMGDVIRLSMVEEIVEGGAVQLTEASVRLAELGREIVGATPERAAEIVGEMQRLKVVQEEARGLPPTVRLVPVGESRTYREDWDAAEDDEQRRAILGDALDMVLVRRGHSRERLARLEFVWRPHGDIEPPDDATLARWATQGP